MGRHVLEVYSVRLSTCDKRSNTSPVPEHEFHDLADGSLFSGDFGNGKGKGSCVGESVEVRTGSSIVVQERIDLPSFPSKPSHHPPLDVG